MTPTSQLRILRSSPRAYPFSSTICASAPSLAATRRSQQTARLVPRRAFSTTTSSPARDQAQLQQARFDDDKPITATTTTTITTASTTQTITPSTALNPPSTTRPPPLDLPTRSPDTSTASHLFATGKAYLTFYKTGLKNIYQSWRLLQSLDTASPNGPAHPAPGTRAALLLRRRVAHDTRRLAPFALILLVCGELTPFVVLAVPRLVPSACRIPRQAHGLKRAAEERRRASWARLWSGAESQAQARGDEAGAPVPQREHVIAHLARSLDLVSPLWDRLPSALDGVLARAAAGRVRRRLALLAEDDALLRAEGGVGALAGEEVVLAVEDRGVSTLEDGGEEKEVRRQRGALEKLVYLTEPWRPGGVGAATGAATGPMLGTPEMVACLLVSGGKWDEKPREELRRRAEGFLEAWGGRLV